MRDTLATYADILLECAVFPTFISSPIWGTVAYFGPKIKDPIFASFILILGMLISIAFGRWITAKIKGS